MAEERGEVRSLLVEMLKAWGPAGSLAALNRLAAAAVWDTRVWMAASGRWPSAADRYASNLGRASEILDPFLREFTEAVERSTIPILTGGHGVVAGGLVALLESLGGGWSYQP